MIYPRDRFSLSWHVTAQPACPYHPSYRCPRAQTTATKLKLLKDQTPAKASVVDCHTAGTARSHWCKCRLNKAAWTTKLTRAWMTKLTKVRMMELMEQSGSNDRLERAGVNEKACTTKQQRSKKLQLTKVRTLQLTKLGGWMWAR